MMKDEVSTMVRDSIQLFQDPISNSILELRNTYTAALINGNSELASQLILNAVANNTIDIKTLYIEIFQQILIEVGYQWKMKIIDIYQEHYFSFSIELIMSQLYPYFSASDKNGHSFVSLSASGDPHTIGIRMVTDFFALNGWHTYFLGSDISTESVLKSLNNYKADVLAISCTMLHTLTSVKCLITAIRNSEELKNVKIIVGGNLFNSNRTLLRSLKADGYSSNADDAVKIANELMTNRILNFEKTPTHILSKFTDTIIANTIAIIPNRKEITYE